MRPQSARERLLDAVIEHLAHQGVGDQSLRRIAEAVGSSHRMLLYHFGSHDGLLLAVAQEVERRTQGELASRVQQAGWATEDLIRSIWAYVSDPELGPFERLFFALYGRALQGDVALRPLLENDVARWLDLNVVAARQAGLDAAAETIRLHARLGLAVVRGLLLDLLATGERDDVGAALDLFAARYEGAGADGGLSAH